MLHQGLKHIPKIYNFIESKTQNCIVMELLGKNLSLHKKLHKNFDTDLAFILLHQMLDSIENLHNKGYIHRDIKPSNFVMDVNNSNQVYMVDFGLAKQHLDGNGTAIPARTNTDFRGTLTYASVNAHNKLVK